MERAVSIRRCKRTGNYVLNPFGTFKGYGGFVGINPYKELPADATPETIAQAAIELLPLSGSTGFHVADIEGYRAETSDEETTRIRRQYIDVLKSTETAARRFLSVELSKLDRQKSWSIVKMHYDTEQKMLGPEEKKIVKMVDGVKSLGEVLLDFLQLPNRHADGPRSSRRR